jgi:sugar-specific transcriptional regulator TrmB
MHRNANTEESIVSGKQTVFEAVDNDMRTAIIQLNRKLRDLHDEITAKLNALEALDEAEHRTQREHLSVLEKEVERALASIDEVVNRVISEELTHSEFLKLHHDDLEKFRDMVTTNADKIAKINKKL